MGWSLSYCNTVLRLSLSRDSRSIEAGFGGGRLRCLRSPTTTMIATHAQVARLPCLLLKRAIATRQRLSRDASLPKELFNERGDKPLLDDCVKDEIRNLLCGIEDQLCIFVPATTFRVRAIWSWF